MRWAVLALLALALVATGVVAGSRLLERPAQVLRSWTATGPMITDHAAHTATLLLDGRVLVTGGTTRDGALAAVELYDPASGSWTATGGMIDGRWEHTATRVLDGRVLVTGGTNLDGALATAELYDAATGIWTATGRMTLARQGTPQPCCSMGGSWWPAARSLPPPSCTTLATEPGPPPGTWSRIASTPQQRCCPMGSYWSQAAATRWHSPSCTTRQRVLDRHRRDDLRPFRAHGHAAAQRHGAVSWAAALRTRSTPSCTTLAADTWTASRVDRSSAARRAHRPPLLPDGTVLVTAATADRQFRRPAPVPALDSAELHAPRTGTWTATPDMSANRRHHARDPAAPRWHGTSGGRCR